MHRMVAYDDLTAGDTGQGAAYCGVCKLSSGICTTWLPPTHTKSLGGAVVQTVGVRSPSGVGACDATSQDASPALMRADAACFGIYRIRIR